MCESRTPHMNESHSNMCPKTCIHELRRGKSYKLHTWVSHELHTWTSHTVICAPKHVYTNFPKHVYTNFVEEWGTNYTHEWVTNSTHVTYIGARFAVNKTAIRAPILPVHEWVTNFICEYVPQRYLLLNESRTTCMNDSRTPHTNLSHVQVQDSPSTQQYVPQYYPSMNESRILYVNESRSPYVNELRTAYVRQPGSNDSSLYSDVAAVTCFYVRHEWVTNFICERVTNSIREWATNCICEAA